MVTIPLELTNDLARRVLPLQDRLPEIIELGLNQIALKENGSEVFTSARQQMLDALASTGIVTLPIPVATAHKARRRHTPIEAGGPLASETIIQERG